MTENNESERLISPSSTTYNPVITGSTLSWSHIFVETRVPAISWCPSVPSLGILKRKKQDQKSPIILNNLTGIVRPGEILAIMGTSGVGKTTLMNVLSGNCGDNALITTGNVYLNETITTDSQRQKDSAIGYVEQQEFFIETLTLQEHLNFQAMLGIRLELTDDERRSRVKNTIAQLHLTKCMRTIIQKLSGGEKKRLALASVFLMDSHVLLIDEPTSGLDAYLAMHIMSTIRSMVVDRRRAIIVVIHQPTDSMFDLVDKICLLVRGGRQAFFGSKDRALEFFATECKLSSSSLDGFIEQLAAPPAKKTDQDIVIQEVVADRYAKSEHATSLEMAVQHNIESTEKNGIINTPSKMKGNTFGRQLKWLLWRSFLADARNPIRTTFVLIRTLIPAFIFGLLYFHLCNSGYFVQNVNALNIAVISLIINTSTHMILSTMPMNNNIGIRESHRGMYSIFSYYLSVVLHDFPTFIIFPFVVNTIIYLMSGMDNTWMHYFAFCGLGILASTAGASFGQLFASFSESIESAISTAVPALQALSIFSGFYLNLVHTPSLLRIVQYISPYYYYYSSLLTLQWNSNTYNHTMKCTHSESLLVTSTQSTSSIFSLAVNLCTRVLQHINFWQILGNVGFNVLMLFVLASICHTIAFIAIWYRAHRRDVTEYLSKMKKKNKKNYQPLK